MTLTESVAAGVPHYTEVPPPAGVNVGQTERVLSAVAGGVLAAVGLSRRSLPGLALAGLGGALVARGTTGHCPAYTAAGFSTADVPAPVEIVQSVSVTASRADAYAFWRKLENLPRFMEHLRTVEAVTETRSRWTARGLGPLPDVSWEAEIVEDVPGERIVWQSLPGADIDNAGHVRFTDGPGGLTEIHARIAYRPPAGALGVAVAGLLGPVLGSSVRQDIARFKHFIEAGEVPRADPNVRGV